MTCFGGPVGDDRRVSPDSHQQRQAIPIALRAVRGDRSQTYYGQQLTEGNGHGGGSCPGFVQPNVAMRQCTRADDDVWCISVRN
jgi:hypothetical protein